MSTPGEWTAALHEAICRIPSDDPDLGFLCSLLAQCVDRPGLTPRQARWAERILNRIESEHGARSRQSVDLTTVRPWGAA